MERYISATEVKHISEELQQNGHPTAHTTITRGQKIAGITLIVLMIALALLDLVGMLTFIIATFTGVFLLVLLTKTIVTGASLDSGMIVVTQEQLEELKDEDLPQYGILVPLRGEENVIHELVDSLSQLDYPTEKLAVILLLEENDPTTVHAVQNLHLPEHFHVLVLADEGPRTKPKACNIGAWYAREIGVDRIVIYDAEDRVEADQLKKAVIAYDQTGASCIQARLEYHNPGQNILTRLFSAEYATFYNLFLPGLGKLNWLVPLGGTSNHFILQELWNMGCWDPTNVTEDMDLGVRMASLGKRVKVLDSVTWEEANSHIWNWVRQRSRWQKGAMQTWLVHMRNPLKTLKGMGIINFLVFQVLIGGTPISLLLSPLFLLLTAVYILSRTSLASIDPHAALFVQTSIEQVYPWYSMYAGTICLVFGNFALFYFLLAGNISRGLYDNTKWMFLVPFYWLLMSFATWYALVQLITRPHYWEKTQHGLSAKTRHESLYERIESTIAQSLTKETLPEEETL